MNNTETPKLQAPGQFAEAHGSAVRCHVCGKPHRRCAIVCKRCDEWMSLQVSNHPCLQPPNDKISDGDMPPMSNGKHQ
jgi:hypothetical protein